MITTYKITHWDSSYAIMFILNVGTFNYRSQEVLRVLEKLYES
jgi:hypothetical protein